MIPHIYANILCYALGQKLMPSHDTLIQTGRKIGAKIIGVDPQVRQTNIEINDCLILASKIVYLTAICVLLSLGVLIGPYFKIGAFIAIPLYKETLSIINTEGGMPYKSSDTGRVLVLVGILFCNFVVINASIMRLMR